MTPVEIAHATLPLERVGMRWRVLTPTQAVLCAEHGNLSSDLTVALVIAGPRPARAVPSWMATANERSGRR